MNESKILLFKDRAKAEAKYGFYREIGNNVMLIGPTDIVRSVGETPSAIDWDSGAAADWHMLIVTTDPVWAGGPGITER